MNWEQEISLEPENLEQEINLESENVFVIGGDNYYDASWLFEVETASQQQYDRLLHAMAVKKRIVLASEQEVYNAIAYLDNNNNIAIVVNNDGIDSYGNTSYADNVVTYFIVDKNTKAISSQVGETNGATFAAQINELSSSIESKQDKIDSSHKLASDLVDDTNQTNQFVTIIDKTNWDAKYDKPSAGIPKTDLTSTVQTSLEKADTAVQPSDLSIVATSGSYNDLSNKPKINNVELSGNKSSSDLGLQPSGNYALASEIPTKTSDIENDSGFITNTVNDLVNYYKKSETFTKQEVNDLISAISTLTLEVVQTLPTQDISTTTIYLVPKTTSEQNDVYDEYIYVSNAWEHIGSTEVDLTNYVTNTDYASNNTGGVIKTSTGNAIATSSSGYLYANRVNYSDYSSSSDNMFISKGTLENVITGKGLITSSSDITGNASTSTTLKAFNYNRNGTSNTWAKVATASFVGAWEEKHAYLFVKGTHNTNFKQNGIISIDAVGNAIKSKVKSYSAQFISASTDLNVENFYIEYQDGDANTNATINFWVNNTTNAYASWQFKILQNAGWTIKSADTSVTTLPTQDFTGKNAELSNVSLKAINDKNGNDITTTYVKNTDYASSSKGGIVKVSSANAVSVNSNTGTIFPSVLSYLQYISGGNWQFISKGTLENVITGKELDLKRLSTYDATKTQVLKNINGTLTWVNE